MAAGQSYQLHPAGRYSSAPPLNPETPILYPGAYRLYPPDGVALPLDGQVDYRVLGDPVLAAVSVTGTGLVTALRPGRAIIEASFGAATDRIQVWVEPNVSATPSSESMQK